jgi:hypothetical protein
MTWELNLFRFLWEENRLIKFDSGFATGAAEIKKMIFESIFYISPWIPDFRDKALSCGVA